MHTKNHYHPFLEYRVGVQLLQQVEYLLFLKEFLKFVFDPQELFSLALILLN